MRYWFLFIVILFVEQVFAVNVLIGVYKDPECKKLIGNGVDVKPISVVPIDLSKKCSTFTYVDRSNIKTPGALSFC